MLFICKKYLSTLHTNKYSDNFLILPLFSLIEYDKSCIAHIIYSWSKSEKSAVLARFIFVPYPCLFWEGLRPEHNCCGPTHHYQSIANENKKKFSWILFQFQDHFLYLFFLEYHIHFNALFIDFWNLQWIM